MLHLKVRRNEPIILVDESGRRIGAIVAEATSLGLVNVGIELPQNIRVWRGRIAEARGIDATINRKAKGGL